MHRNSQQQLSCAHLTKQKSLPMGYLGSNLVSFTASILFFSLSKKCFSRASCAPGEACSQFLLSKSEGLIMQFRWLTLEKKKAKICRFLVFCHASVSRYTFFATALAGWCPGLIGNSVQLGDRTLDGWNPAPVDRHFIPLFTGFSTSQVIVLDFFHQQ